MKTVLSVRLREATAEDADAIAALFLRSRKRALPYLRQVHPDEDAPRYFREGVLPCSRVQVAEVDGVIAGFFALCGKHLDHLYVDPDFQNRRLGTALLLRARALSPERLELHTFARNTGARRFYERHGFEAVAFGSDNEEHEPDVLYRWSA